MTDRPRRYHFGVSRPALALATVLAAGWAASVAARAADSRPDAPPAGHTDGRIAAARQRINPNVASIASLRRLPQIGPTRAQAIVAYRRAHGPVAFRRADDLRAVHGIGPATVRGIEAYLDLPDPNGP